MGFYRPFWKFKMKPYYDTDSGQVFHGHALDVLRSMPDEFVQMCVTSPPYWGLRDYGVDGQLGLEKTPEEYIANMVQIFSEVKRVLRNDGTLWLNMGDSYASDTKGDNRTIEQLAINSTLGPKRDGLKPDNAARKAIIKGTRKVIHNLKTKDLCGIPWMLAFALRADGWYLRQDIIWSKLNPMPESVKDRCCKSHEYMFLLTKSAKYYFDSEAIKEDSVGNKTQSMGQEISTNREGESGGQEVLLFREGTSDQEGLQGKIRTDGRTEGTLPDYGKGTRKRGEIQDSEQAILAKSEGEGAEGKKRQGLYENREWKILQTENGNKAQTSNQDNGLYLDTGSMEGTQGTPQTPLCVLPTENGTFRNGSCDSSIKGRTPYEREHSSGMSDLQCKKGCKDFNSTQGGGGTSFIGHSGYKKADGTPICGTKRLKRSVWTIPTSPMPDAHFATFPKKLIEPCVLAGTSEKGCCVGCGAPLERVVERTPMEIKRSNRGVKLGKYGKTSASGTMTAAAESKTIGWQPTCKCKPIAYSTPCTVLDPFFGSGTTGLVAYRHGRKFVGIELSQTYLDDIAIPRIEQERKQLKLF